MSIYDRDYMKPPRRQNSRFGGLSAEWSPVKTLIFANVAVFFIEAFADRAYGAGTFFEWFGLSLQGLGQGRIWTLLTYSFLHADILHIFCNMLGLFFIGKYLEKALGAGRFLALYFSGALCGGLLWAILAAFQNSPEVLVGASASVMAVFAGFCIVYPPVPITFLLFFVLPISLRPLTMLKIAAALEFLGLAYTFAGGDAVVAYSAHIGGLVSGVAFVCALRRLKNAHFKSPLARSRAGWNPKGGRASDYPFKVNISDSKDLSREIDRILDKISRDGFASLSDEERETLRRARDSLK